MEIFGLRFFFYAKEHLPIHVHLQNADGKAKIALEPDIELIENNGIKPKDLKRAMSVIEQYRDEFVEKWKQFHLTMTMKLPAFSDVFRN
ncbi:MAG: DUF4160 domain-containing protein [Bacteroidaceae bacterium]|nr:DUF4160 domain-containing protein [Bacteroidaceae bacterium]